VPFFPGSWELHHHHSPRRKAPCRVYRAVALQLSRGSRSDVVVEHELLGGSGWAARGRRLRGVGPERYLCTVLDGACFAPDVLSAEPGWTRPRRSAWCSSRSRRLAGSTRRRGDGACGVGPGRPVAVCVVGARRVAAVGQHELALVSRRHTSFHTSCPRARRRDRGAEDGRRPSGGGGAALLGGDRRGGQRQVGGIGAGALVRAIAGRSHTHTRACWSTAGSSPMRTPGSTGPALCSGPPRAFEALLAARPRHAGAPEPLHPRGLPGRGLAPADHVARRTRRPVSAWTESVVPRLSYCRDRYPRLSRIWWWCRWW